MTKLQVVLVAASLAIRVQVGSADDVREALFNVQNDPLQRDTAQQSFSPGMMVTADAETTSPLDSRPGKPISRSGAALRSLIIPGWGESYLGYHGTAKLFFWTDVAIWTTAIGLEVYSRWQEDQFFAFASEHAGARMSGKTDQFYADIGNYDDTEAYNAAKLRERNYDALYTSASYAWAWDSSVNRTTYDKIRISSRRAHNNVYFFLGAAALNRLISFIDTGKKARDVIRAQQSLSVGFHLQPELREGTSSVRLVFSAEF